MTSACWAAGLLLVSAALLACELLLMRLLTLAYWGHFAGPVISLAMLGIASSGLFLFFARERVNKAPERFFAISAGLFGLTAPLAFLLSQQLPFTPFLLTWSLHEYALLAARSLLFFVAFFLGGIAIGLPFVARVLPMGRLYAWNMLGSGLPSLGLLWAMNVVHPMRLFGLVTIAALGASLIATRRPMARLGWSAAGVGVIAAIWFTPFRYSEYKDLPKTLLLPGAKIIEERYGWDGVVQIVDSPHTRYLPGLSLNFAGTLPPARLVFTDAGAMTPVFLPKEMLGNAEFLSMTPEAFSFAITDAPRVLQLYGSSAELLRARALGARDLLALDESATRVAAIKTLSGQEGRFLERVDAREGLERRDAKMDVIGVSLLGTHGTSTAGAASLEPSYLLTIEGCSRLFDRLSPGGHTVFSTWIENPPKSGLRLIALWSEILKRKGVTNPSANLMAIRSWATLSLFVGREPFPPSAIVALKKFCADNSFDLVWFDGIDPAETNQINVLPEEPYYEAFFALLGPGRQAFMQHSPFALEPPSDNRPFFNQYFRWRAVPQWLTSMGLSWLPYVEWGYILQAATLAVVTLLGAVILFVPFIFVRARPSPRSAALFFSLGVAYMFVQIWAIYKLSQLLGHPLLAAAIVLSAMLVASGAGAATLTVRENPRALRNFLLLLLALSIAAAIFPLFLRSLYPLPAWTRLVAGILWLALPAFFMGFPFPFSLARLAKPSDVPWALALNGFGSVVGSLLATLVAVHFGFFVLVASALGLYVVVWLLSCERYPQHL